MNEYDEYQQFRNDISRFSGNYIEFLVIAKSKENRMLWKSTDSTWAIGAANRYLNSVDEADREVERRDIQEGA